MKMIRSISELVEAFNHGVIGENWEVCIDSGGHHLRYIGEQEIPPDPPAELSLSASPWELLEEAFNWIGIPAERA